MSGDPSFLMKEPTKVSYAQKYLRLGVMWGAAFVLAFVLIALVYRQFYGRDRTVINEAIYENYITVGEPGYAYYQTAEGHGLTSYGENGLIVDKTIQSDTYHILFQGDSYVKSAQVSDPDKFTEIIEREWNEQYPSAAIQTLNLGMEGLDLRYYLSFADNIDNMYHPDKLFLMLGENDFKSIAADPDLLQQVAAGDFDEPLVKPVQNSLFKTVTNDIGMRAFMRQLKTQIQGFSQQNTATEEDALATESLDREAVRIQLQALQSLWGDRLVILYFVWIPDLGEGLPETYDDMIMEEMDALGISYVSLYESFRAAFAAHTPPTGFNNSLIGHGHWNRLGHQLAADEIVGYLKTAVPHTLEAGQ